MTILSISLPRWVNYSVTTPTGDHIFQTIGLHRSCSNLRDPPCQTFPTDEQCDAASDDKGRFCHLWRSAGFLANLAVAVQLVTVVAYVFVVAGGKQKRDQGWKVLAGLLTTVGVVEYFIIGIVVSLDLSPRPPFPLLSLFFFLFFSFCFIVCLRLLANATSVG